MKVLGFASKRKGEAIKILIPMHVLVQEPIKLSLQKKEPLKYILMTYSAFNSDSVKCLCMFERGQIAECLEALGNSSRPVNDILATLCVIEA